MLQDKLLKVIRIVLAILVIFWFILLYYFSSQNGVESSKLSRKAVENILEVKDEIESKIKKIKTKICKLINKDIQNDTNYVIISSTEKTESISDERILRWEKVLRKLAHFGLFTLGGFLLYLFLVSLEDKLEYSERRLLLSIFIGIMVAIFDEFHQKFSVGRSPELRDVFIDSCGTTTGSLIAILTVWLLVRIIDYILKRKKKLLKDSIK